jgi:hypothetical protein
MPAGSVSVQVAEIVGMRRASRSTLRQPSASADCYAPLIECSSFDLNALDPMALPDAFMLFERGKFDATAYHTTIRSMHSHSHRSSTLLPLLAAKQMPK